MFSLNEQQILRIASDVNQAGINYSHLGDDIIDHICCDIESRMNHEDSFEKAYQAVKEEFGIKGLRQIQQDTLMLIDKNYRIMKNSMKWIGMLAMALMAFGALFKIFHWPGASVMLLVSFFCTALVFYPTLLYVIYKEVNHKKQAIIYITSFLSGLAFMVGVLFMLLHWPYGKMLFTAGLASAAYVLLPMITILRLKATNTSKSAFLLGIVSLMIVLTGQIFKFLYLPGAAILLSLGAILLVAVFIPVYYFTNVRKSEKIRIDFIFGLIGITFFIVFTFLLSLKNRYSTAVFENSYPSYESTADYFNKSNTALFPLVSSSELIHWMDEANQLYNQIEGLKIEITKHHFRVNTDDAKAILKNHSHFNNNELTTNFLLSDTNPEKPLLVLEKAIEKFQNNYLEFTDNLHTKDRTPLFDTDWTAPYESDQNVTWETYHFAQKPSIKSIQLLSLWQMNIRIMENEVLTASVKTQKSISYEQSNL